MSEAADTRAMVKSAKELEEESISLESVGVVLVSVELGLFLVEGLQRRSFRIAEYSSSSMDQKSTTQRMSQ
jgi:hypothetical protein